MSALPAELGLPPSQLSAEQQQIAALHQQLQEMQAAGMRVTHERDTLIARAHQAAPRSAAAPYRPKIPQPAAFTGEGATATNVEEFKDSMQRLFEYYPESFANDAAKLQHAIMFLQGKAATWWKATKKEFDALEEPVTTWPHFMQLLDERYRPRQAAETARMRLDSLRQDRRDVRAYADFFHKQMAYISDMAMADQIHVFIRGLSVGVKAEVLRAQPKTVSDAINAAVQAEQLPGLARSYGSYGRGGAGGGNGGTAPMDLSHIALENDGEFPPTDSGVPTSDSAAPGGPSGAAASSSGSNLDTLAQALMAMQVNQQQTTQQLLAMFQRGGPSGRGQQRKKNQVSGVTKEEVRVCRDKGLCLKCKQSGHFARECKYTGATVPLPAHLKA
jgi:hypothetical protein